MSNLDQFYIADDPHARGAFRADPADVRLPLRAFAAGSSTPDAPVVFEHSSGKHLFDWVNTGLVGVYLVSATFTALLQENGFTGWGTYPIELRDQFGDLLPTYSGLSINGRCGPLDDSNNPVILHKSEYTGALVQARIGFHFDPASWDGSDFFIPTGSWMCLVSERVKRVVEEAGIKNVRLRKVSEVVRFGTTAAGPT